MENRTTILCLGLIFEIAGAWFLAWGVITGTKVRFKYSGKEIEKDAETLVGTQRQHAKWAINEKIGQVRRRGIIGAIGLTLGFMLQLIGLALR